MNMESWLVCLINLLCTDTLNWRTGIQILCLLLCIRYSVQVTTAEQMCWQRRCNLRPRWSPNVRRFFYLWNV